MHLFFFDTEVCKQMWVYNGLYIATDITAYCRCRCNIACNVWSVDFDIFYCYCSQLANDLKWRLIQLVWVTFVFCTAHGAWMLVLCTLYNLQYVSCVYICSWIRIIFHLYIGAYSVENTRLIGTYQWHVIDGTQVKFSQWTDVRVLSMLLKAWSS